ncbi:chorismate synthase [Lactonifactor longoviformis]|uniref:Chorismate synthase n=1 Tax=Lactonifactor longoviformis DSM 17459 TaxID=1122155 RepID=A0A1M5BVB4_9CLOT|nr:chorismate synthase [Lactonifactor longoviformis]POP31805.1 chorismate synthase [Lactonifactor longoviformis]SHF46438.1 chorismate synthase [Lactonifactor longoviformis DSM 17459]
MYGSTFGNILKISTWGESHGAGLGVVVDGCPAGLPLSEEDVQRYLNRRKPGQSRYATPRREEDAAEILSGVFEGKTTGTPISMMIRNKDQRSRDYSEIAGYYRPGHADYNYDQKYGFRDYRGGGRSSGRETIGRVAAGAIASKILEQLGITLSTYTLSIGPVAIDKGQFDETAIWENPFYMPDKAAALKAEEYLKTCMKDHNSSGGMIECIIKNVPGGLGEPAFEKLDANLGKAIFSIGAVKAVEIGDGLQAAEATGLTNNDPYACDTKGSVRKLSNHAGGITGGISDGCNTDIILRAAIKPTPSIAAPQQTVNRDGENIEITIKGRHDPVIVPRAVVVVESMAALVIADALLGSMTSRMDKIIKFFR